MRCITDLCSLTTDRFVERGGQTQDNDGLIYVGSGERVKLSLCCSCVACLVVAGRGDVGRRGLGNVATAEQLIVVSRWSDS